jgi:hypothetical protein
METIVSGQALFDGLNPDERRRLYFLLLVADHLEPREALVVAERMEAFITAKAVSKNGESRGGVRRCGAGEMRPAIGNVNRNPTCPGDVQRPLSAPRSLPASPADRMDKSAQTEFFKAAAHGASNADLAERFGRTKRQAHALRIGAARRLRTVAPTAKIERKAATESSRSSTGSTEGEVVRFLRQVGDVVVVGCTCQYEAITTR